MKQWNEAFKERGKVFLGFQQDLPKVAEILKNRKAKKILDLGSGSGRHSVYLAKKGFEVYGFDIAGEGIAIAKKWLKQEGLCAQFKEGSIFEKLPYNDDFFDAVISTQTIYHGSLDEVRKSIQEIERILKPNGMIFITVRKRGIRGWNVGKIIRHRGNQSVDYKVLAPRTYVPLDGEEKDLPHFLFNRKLIRKEFKKILIKDIWTDSEKNHYCFIGYLK